MGILQNLTWVTALVTFALVVSFAPLSMYLKGWVLRLHGASKAEVKGVLLEMAQNDHTLVQIVRALRGTSEPVNEPERQAQVVKLELPNGSPAEERSSSP